MNTINIFLSLFGENAIANYVYIVSFLLFAIGFSMLLFHHNLIKKIIGMDIMDSGVYLFLTAMGYYRETLAPIGGDLVTNDIPNYSNPIPPGLVLTGIVVSVSVSAIMLALAIRLYKKYHTLELDKIFMFEKKQHDLEK
ncbi:MAG: cation:proton antiporter subunit C [Erysipelotrichaceae bacterium]|nr:cation:proton antiporter subunit C [Erysipelotrichaceae bacterium]